MFADPIFLVGAGIFVILNSLFFYYKGARVKASTLNAMLSAGFTKGVSHGVYGTLEVLRQREHIQNYEVLPKEDEDGKPYFDFNIYSDDAKENE